MSQIIFRVHGVYATGHQVSHLVGATDAKTAMASVLNADPRIIRITKAIPEPL